MNSLPIGIILTILTFIYAGEGSEVNDLVQMHSLVMVVGGTFAIFLFATPTPILRSLKSMLPELFRPEKSFNFYKEELIEVTKSRKLKNTSDSPLLNYAVELWEQGIDPNLFIVLVSQKKKELDSVGVDVVQSLKNLTKYPPALGMAGTVMGMIGLFNQLEGQKENIGSLLALAMTATFFGLVLTNALVAPLADRMQIRQVQKQRLNSSIYEIILLVNRNEPASLIVEDMEARVA